ncbi:hypothetical protein GY12_06570 [Micrococcus luteus]|nr:hypothetical protein GY12_06570 [Micrococcus luteus]
MPAFIGGLRRSGESMRALNKQIAAALAAVCMTITIAPSAVAASSALPHRETGSITEASELERVALVGETSATGLSFDELDDSSIAARVERAASFKEVKKVLLKEGFRVDRDGSTSDTVMFVKKAGGATVNFEIWTQEARDRILTGTGEVQPLAKVGWNWSKGGPYIEATAGEWKTFVKNGINWGSPLCGLIGNVLGAVGCGVVANVIGSYIDSINTDGWPSSMCIAVSAQLRPWVERC